ncbi:hypothetical protein F0562_013786 [Nyssa sinensis]|uniref:Uncharacterized protein n=1 Tax=Nyssa sinensis TaxID=561372 RepID=A0A5J4ZLL6_9ASTE|nr:hypothetical protein F0562_013786 [Nyssa sinensis]
MATQDGAEVRKIRVGKKRQFTETKRLTWFTTGGRGMNLVEELSESGYSVKDSGKPEVLKAFWEQELSFWGWGEGEMPRQIDVKALNQEWADYKGCEAGSRSALWEEKPLLCTPLAAIAPGNQQQGNNSLTSSTDMGELQLLESKEKRMT